MKAIIILHMLPVRARVTLRTAWMVTFALACLAPQVRLLTGIRGGGRWAIYACAGIMVIVALVLPKAKEGNFALRFFGGWGLFTSLFMSASAMAWGAGAGFLLLALAGGKSLTYFLAVKWGAGAVFLTWLYRKQLARPIEPPTDEEMRREWEEQILCEFKERFLKNLPLPDGRE
ncbi:MAG: hypothetical protein ACR2HJ_03970 [Fimbriimonadales bacterium]